MTSHKILIIGETCTDKFIYGYSNRLCPDVTAPVFITQTQTDNLGMASNVAKNIQSILDTKYFNDKDYVKLLTNHSTKDYITKTRYVIERNNTTLIRVDVGEKQYGHISDYYSKWKDLDFSSYDCIVISDYNKGFLSEDDIQYIISKNNKIFLDTKKKLGKWCEDVLFIKINNFEYDNSKDYLSDKIKDKLVVTLGSKGSLYKDEIFPVKNVGIKDVCGAGDSYFAGFIVMYLKTQDIIKSIKFANKCATIVVQKKGVVAPFGDSNE